jgi:hypothetical protein
MGSGDLEPAILEEARNSPKDLIVAAPKQAQKLRQIPHETGIDSDAKEVWPAQAANEYKPAAAFASEDAQHAPDLANMHISVREALDVRRCASGKAGNERIVAGPRSSLGDSYGKCSAASDDPDAGFSSGISLA